MVYPCTGLIDNVGLNAGIGTTKPFKYAGAVGLDAYRLAAALNARNLPGVYFRPAYWSPFFGALKEQQIGGVELDVFDPYSFQSVRTAVELISAVRAVSPQTISISAKPLAIDWGTDTLASGLTEGLSAPQILEQWQPALARFKAIRAKYLVY